MEGNRMEIQVVVEIFGYTILAIYYIGHNEHKEQKRRRKRYRYRRYSALMLAAIKGVQGEHVKEKTAVMERERVGIVNALLKGGYLLEYLHNDKRYGNYHKRYALYSFALVAKKKPKTDRQNGKYYELGYYGLNV